MSILKLVEYSIFIGKADPELSQIISQDNYSKIAILVDENTRQHCLPVLLKNIEIEHSIIEIPAGEQHKNLSSCRHIWEEMMLQGMDRHSLLLNLGGGVIGDMGGFCAATYMRGIDFVQIPTTLLAQVDASIGGKLGIDFNLVKNSIGLFKNPKAVFVNPVFLQTLPESEIWSGFAEVFKHALIADADLWHDLQKVTSLSALDWQPLLARSLRIKKQVVEIDPYEKGLRKALNFGHTIGHAVESFSFSADKPLLHGEAVAIGIVCESWLSNKEGGLSQKSLEQIAAFVKKRYPSFSFQEKDFPRIMEFMKKDKKNRDGRINFTFIPEVGKVEWDQYCEEEIIRESLRYYLSI